MSSGDSDNKPPKSRPFSHVLTPADAIAEAWRRDSRENQEKLRRAEQEAMERYRASSTPSPLPTPPAPSRDSSRTRTGQFGQRPKQTKLYVLPGFCRFDLIYPVPFDIFFPPTRSLRPARSLSKPSSFRSFFLFFYYPTWATKLLGT